MKIGFKKILIFYKYPMASFQKIFWIKPWDIDLRNTETRVYLQYIQSSYLLIISNEYLTTTVFLFHYTS